MQLKKKITELNRQATINNLIWGSEETNLRVGGISGQFSRKGNLGSVPRSAGDLSKRKGVDEHPWVSR